MTPQADSATMPLEEALARRPSWLSIWWGVLTHTTSTWKELADARQLITRLESGELAEGIVATRALKKVEQAIIKMGDTNKSPKTMRHELLALLDKEYHQELGSGGSL